MTSQQELYDKLSYIKLTDKQMNDIFLGVFQYHYHNLADFLQYRRNGGSQAWHLHDAEEDCEDLEKLLLSFHAVLRHCDEMPTKIWYDVSDRQDRIENIKLEKKYKNATVVFCAGWGELLCSQCRSHIKDGLEHEDKEYICKDCRIDAGEEDI